MQTALALYEEPLRPGRRLERIPLTLDATLRDTACRTIGVTVHNITSMGLMIEATAPLDIGAVVRIRLSGVGETAARIVWANQTLHGLAFLDDLSDVQMRRAQGADIVRLVEQRRPPVPSAGCYRSASWPARRARIVTIAALAASLWVMVIGGILVALRY